MCGKIMLKYLEELQLLKIGIIIVNIILLVILLKKLIIQLDIVIYTPNYQMVYQLKNYIIFLQSSLISQVILGNKKSYRELQELNNILSNDKRYNKELDVVLFRLQVLFNQINKLTLKSAFF